MDKQTKTKIKNLVLKLRDDFEKEIENRLNNIGIYPDKEWKDGRSLPHLKTKKQLDNRRRVAAFIRREEKIGIDRKTATKEFIKEVSYTWINRLLGLKCMECRGLIEEMITTRPEFGDRSRYHRNFRENHPDLAVQPDDGLIPCLFSAFKEVTEEIKVLFDPENEYSLVVPRYPFLKKAIQEINDDLDYDTYREDEFLGWVYQYFNSREKDRVFEEVRTKKKKIAGSDIINVTQLYTEKYMVRFLVENSLGAMWMEMYPDSHLCERWEYFVRDPNNSIREPKPVKEITFLDPACGSGHFLLYAFDLYYDMYLEEGIISEDQVPEFILRHNLHGIDIDLRAIQLSALGLFMKAKSMQPDMKVQHMNLVSADAIMLDSEILEEFLEEFRDDSTAQELIETIWQGLENVRELGSLLKVEEQIDGVIERQKSWGSQKSLDARDWKEKGWEHWKLDLLAKLKGYYEKAAQTFDINKQMFANEACKGVQLLDLLEQRYDVVATNPPYCGKTNIGKNISDFLDEHYPKSKYDLYSAFLERCTNFNIDSGFSSMICQNTFMFTSHFNSFRIFLAENTWIRTFAHLGPGAFVDIGGEVVNSIMIIANKNRNNKQNIEKIGVFIRCIENNNKSECLQNKNKILYHRRLSHFSIIPGMPFSYWASDNIFSIFKGNRLLEDSENKSFVKIRGGMSTSNNDKFLRLFWEVPYNKIDNEFKDFLMGEGGPKWYSSNNTVINWKNDGEDVKKYAKSLYGTETRTIKNQQFFFKEGLSYNPISASGIRVRYVAKGAIYSNASNGIFINDQIDKEFIMAFLNSKMANYLLKMINPSLNANPGDVKRIPFKPPNMETEKIVLKIANCCINIKKSHFQFIVNDRDFKQTAIQWGYNQSLGEGEEINE